MRKKKPLRAVYVVGILLPIAFYMGIFVCQHRKDGSQSDGEAAAQIVTAGHETEKLQDKLSTLQQKVKEQKAVEALRNLQAVAKERAVVAAAAPPVPGNKKKRERLGKILSLAKSTWTGPMTYGALGKGTYSLKIGSLSEKKVAGSKFSIVGSGEHSAFDQQANVKISIQFTPSGEKAEVSLTSIHF